MSRPIRRIALVLGVLLLALLVNVTVIQVVLAGDYRDRPGNQRVLLEEYAREQIKLEEGHIAEVEKMLRRPGDLNPAR